MLYFSFPPSSWPGAPGAWGSAMQPHIVGQGMLQPHIVAQGMLQPHILGQGMLQPHIVGRSGPPHLKRGHSPDELHEAERQAAVAAFGWPWFGADTSWTGYGPAALQAHAIDKVRTRILRPTDPRIAKAALSAPARNRKAPSLQAKGRLADIWRWQGPFRVKAVVAELSSHLRVQGHELYWLGDIQLKSLPSVCPLIDIVPPGPRFDYAEQIDKVLRAAVERQDRLPEILSQSDEILQFFDAVTGIDRAGAPRLAELLETVWEVGSLVVMAIKNSIAELRPFQRNDAVQPLIPTPGHGSLPSGHATMATLASELLAALRYQTDPERCEQLDQLARRIAFNRVVAGVHFPMDSHAGYKLGRCVAATLLAAAQGGELPSHEKVPILRDSSLPEGGPRQGPVQTDPKQQIAALSNWSMLWAAAADELRQQRV